MEEEKNLQATVEAETQELDKGNFHLFGAIYLSTPEGGSRIKTFKLATGESSLTNIEHFSAAVAATIFLAIGPTENPTETKQIGRAVALDMQSKPLDAWGLQKLAGSYCIDPWQPKK